MSERVRTLPAWLRIPTFVMPFLLLWLVLEAGLLPDLATIGILYFLVVVGFGLWGRWIHRQAHPYRTLGLENSPQFYWEMLAGAIAGFGGVFLLFVLEGWLGWVEWPPVKPMVLLLGLLNAIATATAVGFAEELLFRGWLLAELRLNYKGWLAGAVTTFIFAATHQWGAQFLGLLLVGTILVRAKVLSRDRLGLAIGLHGGWVFAISLVNIASLLSPTGSAPIWVTGFDGNPLAGIAGVTALCLTLLGIELYYQLK